MRRRLRIPVDKVPLIEELSRRQSLRKKALERNAEMRKNKVTLDSTEYLKEAEKRKELPDYVEKRIEECVTEILSRHPYTEIIRLIGSYSKGTYIDEFTPEAFKDLKKKSLGTLKISDFDFKIYPVVNEMFITKSGYKVHLGIPRSKHEGRLLNLKKYKL